MESLKAFYWKNIRNAKINKPEPRRETRGRKERQMKKEELKPGMKVWCWWLHRNLWYQDKGIRMKKYGFIDADDCLILIDEDQIKDLEIR